MTRREIESKLQALFDGSLEEGCLEELQRELETNLEAQDAYIDYAQLENMLQMQTQGIDQMRVISMSHVIERQQKRSIRNAVFAAAAVVTLGAIVLALVIARPTPPAIAFKTNPGTQFQITHDA